MHMYNNNNIHVLSRSSLSRVNALLCAKLRALNKQVQTQTYNPDLFKSSSVNLSFMHYNNLKQAMNAYPQ